MKIGRAATTAALALVLAVAPPAASAAISMSGTVTCLAGTRGHLQSYSNGTVSHRSPGSPTTQKFYNQGKWTYRITSGSVGGGYWKFTLHWNTADWNRTVGYCEGP